MDYIMLNHEEQLWSLEKQLCTEDFLVDDLLDLGGIASDLDEQGEQDEEEDLTSAPSGQSPPVAEPIVPEGDISDLEWVSRFVDDSFHAVPPFVSPVPTKAAAQQKLQLHFVPNSASVTSISSPAVSACSSLRRAFTSFSPEALLVPCKTRTKRSRRVWSLSRPELADPLCSSSSSCSSTCSSSSCLVYEPHALSPEVLPLEYAVPRGRGRPPLLKKPIELKKKGRKPKTAAEEIEDGGGGRRCSHCGVQKTPQWRTGPMGAKTLCNACGVRYKSGRLLPEYRPACSPTFVSHVHSNSHRKVLEMRREKELLHFVSTASPADTAAFPVVF